MKGLVWIIFTLILLIILVNKTPKHHLVSDIQDTEEINLITEEEKLYLFLIEEYG